MVVSSLAKLLLTANRAFPMMTIHREKVDAGACSIGRVVDLSKGRVTILEIGPDATWDAPGMCGYATTYPMRGVIVAGTHPLSVPS